MATDNPVYIRLAAFLGKAVDRRLRRYDSYAATPERWRRADRFVGWLYCLREANRDA